MKALSTAFCLASAFFFLADILQIYWSLLEVFAFGVTKWLSIGLTSFSSLFMMLGAVDSCVQEPTWLREGLKEAIEPWAYYAYRFSTVVLGLTGIGYVFD